MTTFSNARDNYLKMVNKSHNDGTPILIMLCAILIILFLLMMNSNSEISKEEYQKLWSDAQIDPTFSPVIKDILQTQSYFGFSRNNRISKHDLCRIYDEHDKKKDNKKERLMTRVYGKN